MTKHMRGGPHFGRHVPETLDKPGAEALAETIRRFWRAKGFEADVWVQRVDEGFTSLFCVRSTMIGGRP